MQQIIYLELTEDGKRLTIDGDLGLLGHLVRTFDESKTALNKLPNDELKEQPVAAGGQGGNHDER